MKTKTTHTPEPKQACECALRFDAGLSTEARHITGIKYCLLHNAAPDLLAALKAVEAFDNADNPMTEDERDEIVRAAVAKAEGR